jgi:hypothetical protein
LVTAGEFGLQLRIGSSFMDDHHFPSMMAWPAISRAPPMRKNRLVQSSPLRV